MFSNFQFIFVFQVDNEVHDFTWNIKNFDFISYIRNRSVLNQHVFSFTVGSSIDKVSTWKLFLAYDAAEKSPALFLQLIEYAGTDEFPVILEVYVDNGINEQFKLSKKHDIYIIVVMQNSYL